MRRAGITSLMLAALAAMTSAAAQIAQPAAETHRPKTRAASRTVQHGAHTGPGWTHAQVKRMALKKRNQQRNRRAQRRAGR